MKWELLDKDERGVLTERAPVRGGYLYRCWINWGFGSGASPTISLTFVPCSHQEQVI